MNTPNVVSFSDVNEKLEQGRTKLHAAGVYALGGLALLTALQLSKPEPGSAEALAKLPTVEHVVRSGEELWRIAVGAEESDGVDGNGDIRAYVEAIKEINNLESSTIYPGDVLEVPTHETEETSP